MVSKEYIAKVRELNKRKIYTKEQLKPKFGNKFLYTYPLHNELWNDMLNKYETVIEVRGVSSREKENFQTVEAIIKGMN